MTNAETKVKALHFAEFVLRTMGIKFNDDALKYDEVKDRSVTVMLDNNVEIDIDMDRYITHINYFGIFKHTEDGVACVYKQSRVSVIDLIKDVDKIEIILDVINNIS